jgi:predicted GIY-YIG superfamily endonuclease
MAVVYLLHFEKPISPKSTCQHYIGFANNLEARVHYHRKGQSGVRLLEVAHERSISFVVARVWEEGSKTLERHLKNKKNAPRLCPICQKELAQRLVTAAEI